MPSASPVRGGKAEAVHPQGVGEQIIDGVSEHRRSRGGTRTPVVPSRTMSIKSPVADATTGRPQAMASSSSVPAVTSRGVDTTRSAARKSSGCQISDPAMLDPREPYDVRPHSGGIPGVRGD